VIWQTDENFFVRRGEEELTVPEAEKSFNRGWGKTRQRQKIGGLGVGSMREPNKGSALWWAGSSNGEKKLGRWSLLTRYAY